MYRRRYEFGIVCSRVMYVRRFGGWGRGFNVAADTTAYTEDRIKYTALDIKAFETLISLTNSNDQVLLQNRMECSKAT